MTLDVSNDYKVKLVDEMYANDEECLLLLVET